MALDGIIPHPEVFPTTEDMCPTPSQNYWEDDEEGEGESNRSDSDSISQLKVQGGEDPSLLWTENSTFSTPFLLHSSI